MSGLHLLLLFLLFDLLRIPLELFAKEDGCDGWMEKTMDRSIEDEKRNKELDGRTDSPTV